jgi:hypothetical protein
MSQIVQESSVYFAHLFLLLLFFVTRSEALLPLIWLRLSRIVLFSEYSRLVIVNIQQTNQHLFILQFSQSIPLMCRLVVMVQRVNFSRREFISDGGPWFEKMFIV